mmetsp:Transcript_58169/g.173044  ORF Transcript_58169/g.173044 Transcript_58169/m.173044 type:complete len:375 (+) Transcript_58169:237-1361(+)
MMPALQRASTPGGAALPGTAGRPLPQVMTTSEPAPSTTLLSRASRRPPSLGRTAEPGLPCRRSQSCMPLPTPMPQSTPGDVLQLLLRLQWSAATSAWQQAKGPAWQPVSWAAQRPREVTVPRSVQQFSKTPVSQLHWCTALTLPARSARSLLPTLKRHPCETCGRPAGKWSKMPSWRSGQKTALSPLQRSSCRTGGMTAPVTSWSAAQQTAPGLQMLPKWPTTQPRQAATAASTTLQINHLPPRIQRSPAFGEVRQQSCAGKRPTIRMPVQQPARRCMPRWPRRLVPRRWPLRQPALSPARRPPRKPSWRTPTSRSLCLMSRQSRLEKAPNTGRFPWKRPAWRPAQTVTMSSKAMGAATAKPEVNHGNVSCQCP